MSDQIRVDPQELYTSGGVARAISSELVAPVDSVVTATRTAAGHLTGWSVAQGLGRLVEGWAPVLTHTRERFVKTAENLEDTAKGHAWNEESITEAWQKATR
ncbi:hypothetical protein ACWEQL_28900 [Kitasatospora sp. NPDC004240]